jgi:hypothetical protein
MSVAIETYPPRAGSAPTWAECEAVFWEMCGSFGRDEAEWRRLNNKYNDMMDEYVKAMLPNKLDRWIGC